MPGFDEFDKVAKEHGQEERSGGDWFRPKEGTSRVRILTEFEPVLKHWDTRQGRSIVCVGKDKGCPYHEEGMSRGSVQYLMWIIDREDGELKIAALPYSVVKPVADWKEMEDYSYDKVPEYDIIINKTKTGSEARDVKYSVTPARKESPLTEEEQIALESATDIADIVIKMKDNQLEKYKDETEPDKKESKKELDPDEIDPEDLDF